MKNLSEEVINIGGKDYTLFLNRKGVLAWEKYAGEENSKVAEIQNQMDNIFNGKNAEIKKGLNPFDDIDEPNGDENDKLVSQSYRKLYWIMLYTHHKLEFEDANKLYDEAIKEYGEAQLVALGVQMINDINDNKFEEQQEPKKLQALKPREK